MPKWTKRHARLIGRIIFADFLEYPLEKYKSFIEKVEASPLFDKRRTIIIARSPSGARATKQSHPNVIAEIVRSGKRFIIRYTYEGFSKVYQFDTKILSTFLHKLRRISSRNELTHRILKGIIEHQRCYLKTGNQIDLVPFSQVQLTGLLNTYDLQLTTKIDISWISRLINKISVITPSGEEKPLKWFFQTQKDINKRLIKQLLDRENEDIESGRLKEPLTDNQIRADLEKEQGLSLSRWAVGHCRKDMGIPPAKRRLSGYKYPPLSANFSMLYPLTMESIIKYAPAENGVYELSIKSSSLRGAIATKQSQTSVIYIGSTRNIRKRLREHLGKNSKNGHIRDFLKKYECSFRYIQFSTPHFREKERELYKLFVATYGAAPRCNRVRP